MADLGSIANTDIDNLSQVIYFPDTRDYPIGAETAVHLPLEVSNLHQALYRWTGTEWEPIYMAYWSGSAWLLEGV